MYELTRKGARFVWDDRCRQVCRQVFETLKLRLCSAPVLATPTSEVVYVLQVDASTHGAGAILHQYQDGQLRVIGYASRLFNGAERSYCTTGHELAAVFFRLKRFRQYLLGRRTVVRSDHGALSYLRRTRDPVAQQAEWLDFIEQFDITVQHRSGSAHRAADALSRRPCDGSSPCKQCTRGNGASGLLLPIDAEDQRCAVVVTRGQSRKSADEKAREDVSASTGC